MSNFIIAIAVFLITVIGALFAIPYFVDWNGYRSVFEEEATRLLGREVRVGGAVNLHLLPTPYFRFEKVRIADTSVNLQEPFFRTDSLTIKLAIPPMIRGVVEANEIELQRPMLRLALDSGDGWNWQSFGEVLGKSTYLPANVALTSVKIVDGVLAVHAPDGAERTRFDGFNGEFSAPALDGPYRLRGTFGKAGAERELQDRHGAAGGGRLGALQGHPAGRRRRLDVYAGCPPRRPHGQAAHRGRAHRAAADRRAVAGAARRPAPDAEKSGRARRRDRAPTRARPRSTCRAAVRADPAGATLTDLALSFEQDGRPQLITGELRAKWRDAPVGGDEPRLALARSRPHRRSERGRRPARQHHSPGHRPARSAASREPLARDLLGRSGQRRPRGRQRAAAVARPLQDKLEIEELRLGLPGGSRGELQGVVTGPPEAPVFDGSIGLRGTSLVRFLGWATAGALTFDAKGDGTFGVRAQLSIAPGRAAARNIVGDLSGTAISADVQYRWEGRPEVSLSLEGPQLDARAFVPAGASLADVFDVVLHGPLMGGQGAARGPGAAKPGWRGAQTDASIRVSARAAHHRRAHLPRRRHGDRAQGRPPRLPLLRVAGDDGFSLELEGEVDDAASRPKGSLRAVAGADTGAAIAPLAELLGIPEAFRPDARRARAMVPLRLAGSMAFGARTPTSADLVLDGEANGAGVKLNARFDGGPAGWRTGPADVTGLVEGNDAQVIAALLAPGGSSGRAGSPGSGRVVVKAIGVPSEGLASLASVETGDLALDFRGRLVARESGNSAAGDLDIRATDGARIAALAGLAPPLRLDGLPIAGSLKFSVDSSTLALDRLALKIGGSDVKGQLSLAAVGERRRVEARLDVDELSARQDARRLAGPAAGGGRDRRDGDLGPPERVVRRAFRRLDPRWLRGQHQAQRQAPRAGRRHGPERGQPRHRPARRQGGGAAARRRRPRRPGQRDAEHRQGGGGRGRQRQPEPGGRNHRGSRRQAAGSRASGALSGEIKFSGKGTSPRSVLSVLQGSGTLSLGEAKLGTLWPGAIGKAVSAALKADPDSLAATLRRTLAAELAAGELRLPDTVSVEIADGRLAAKPFAIDTDEGRAQGAAGLDLKTLLFDSDWRLEPEAPPRRQDAPAGRHGELSRAGRRACEPGAAHRFRRARARARRAPHGARRGGAGAAAQARRGAPPRGGRAPAPAARAGAAAGPRADGPRPAPGDAGVADAHSA